MPRTRRDLNAARHPMPAGRAILVTLLTLGLASLLNIASLHAAAERQPFGWRRSAALVLVAPLSGISAVLGLDEPRVFLDRELALRRERPATSAGQAVSASTRDPIEPQTTQRAFSAGDPLRIWVGGDSMTEPLGPALRSAVARTGVAVAEHELHYSSGLSRPDFFDWPERLTSIAATADPDVWVVMFGANDAQGIRVGGRHLQFGTPEWDAEYRQRVAAVMTDLTSGGQQLVWIGQPVMRTAEFAQRMAHLNHLYRTEAARHDGVTYLDTWDLFTDGDGEYVAYLPDLDGRPALMRLGDGIHLTRPGGERLAARVFKVIDDRWRLDDANRVSP